ncbi:methylmalonyl-CoA mutase family protein [Engelhardtia mirabilis]|uniref:Fused isobutyryl-CoA mutase n=1 Tax=Engelhardtia mirabilis TaxID=2528011 RepID=A0A518BKU4_9BACT|nr:Methylmalonyl-CoA mutase large subunit [Planctomycetes bacterium Pla133]QDV01912.1 Methylmalonyl-CoA mutase large subunit [Planctomycetes bacterium Pla86]
MSTASTKPTGGSAAPASGPSAGHAPETEAYQPSRPIRLVTAASLFDGHDAAINVMRRILQASGAEVIHLGHDRSVAEIVDCAIQEDVQGIAVTSYQGGHVEFFEYMVDLLRERGAGIQVFGGGGGTILPSEIDRLHAHGVARIYSPDDGRSMGLQGMINDLLRRCDRPTVSADMVGAAEAGLLQRHHQSLARLITAAETLPEVAGDLRDLVERHKPSKTIPVLGITGTGGAGKSSLVDELVRRFLTDFETETIAVISVDPSKRRTGGALLGDRIRMNSIHDERVYMRSLATRQANLALSAHVQTAIDLAKVAGHDLVIVETSGIGQSDTEIVEHCDVSLYVMTADYGAATQLEKIDMIDFADCIAINKFDKAGSLDALRDVRKQFQRARQAFHVPVEDFPVFGTIASQFNDAGMNRLYRALIDQLVSKAGADLHPTGAIADDHGAVPGVIPADRVRYLAEIADASKRRDQFTERQTALARRWAQVRGTAELLRERGDQAGALDAGALDTLAAELEKQLDPECRGLLEEWPQTVERFSADKFSFQVRDRVIEQDLKVETLAGLKVPKVALPRYQDPGDVLRWLLTENVPGSFPYASGVFPLKRVGEDPARMFAGEGGPERTNRRFHYVSRGMPAARLSTAFDSVTLYGQDPDIRPDIYGKVGNSGVSIATVDDAKRLYSGFDLCDPKTSVSMTINGPAPMVLAFFMNAAVDQQCEKHLHATGGMEAAQKRIDALYAQRGAQRPVYRGELPEGNDGLGLALLGVSGDEVLDPETYAKIKADTLRVVRGTVQADILKEDQAQNTCIFSTEFALRMMGDIQEYFCREGVRNFYSVSISGYHIAEAGANPITQLAFTLANGFTYVEYYLSRGLAVDDFAPNLSFFFSNGVDAEYAVIGRVARRIWAKAMRFVYGAGERSQKLKYHIQTSGRSLHAQEIAFNDIRTTLQALYAIYDNCQSLHTNAYDEAITTPTEESVRRALAIQLIINKELGLAANENPLQGAFVIEELTDLVEEAVYTEFRRIADRGGVLGAMERMYQRSRIQDESLYYEGKKHDGSLPLVGVNTFLDSKGSPTLVPGEVIRSTGEEQQGAIRARDAFWARNADRAPAALEGLQRAALAGENLFEQLMDVTKVCSLGQISGALFEVGGRYRRNM